MPRAAPRLQVIRRPTRQGAAATRGAAAAAATSPATAADTTSRIADSITSAIVERRLMPGTKLAEQKIADIFKVSRTLVRQALNQLSRDKLITLEPARGARVAEPSVEEARQVFEVRRLLEAAMISQRATAFTPAQIGELRAHLRDERRRSSAPTSRAAPGCSPTFTSCWRACSATRCWPSILARARLALFADRADVPVGPLGRAFVSPSTSRSSMRSRSATRGRRSS